MDMIIKIEIVERKIFNEAKGKELVTQLFQKTECESHALYLSKYVALSSLAAVNSFLVQNLGIGVLEKCEEQVELKYYFSDKFLNLDHKTCICLNLFGNKNSVYSLFSPVTNMGKKLLKRRIN